MLLEAIMMRLAAMAQMSGQNVAPFTLEFTAGKLEALGEGVLPALEKMMETSRRFPLVAEVKAAMGIADVTPEDEGRLVAARIWAAVAKFGEMHSVRRLPELQEYVGPVGWKVVEMCGGWTNLVSGCTYQNETTQKAQWRELAVTIGKTKNFDSRPALEAPERNPILALVSGMGNVVDLGKKR